MALLAEMGAGSRCVADPMLFVGKALGLPGARAGHFLQALSLTVKGKRSTQPAATARLLVVGPNSNPESHSVLSGLEAGPATRLLPAMNFAQARAKLNGNAALGYAGGTCL